MRLNILAAAILKFGLTLTVIAVALSSVVYLAARAPEIHSAIIRDHVGSKVYKITGGPRTGGGTGFAIKGDSGVSYIVTNAHVCEVTPDGRHVLVSNDGGRYMWRRILEVSGKSDLCIVEGLPGVEGLKLGSLPAIGQIVAAVGHPSLMPITLSRGEIIAPEDIAIIAGVVIDPRDHNDQEIKDMVDPAMRLTPQQCSKPKNRVVKRKVNMFWFTIEIKICLDITRGAYRTNMLIQPGNSGSPMVDFWGNVVGVMFAADRYNWGIAVSHKDLKELLSNY